MVQESSSDEQCATAARRVVAACVCTALLFVLMGAAALRSIDHLLELTAWHSRTERTLAQFERLNAGLEAVQAASRGYALTGREEYLLAFNDGQATTTDALGEVRALPELTEIDATMIRQLPGLAQAVVQDAQNTIRVQQSEGAARARDLIATGRASVLQLQVAQRRETITHAVRTRIEAREQEALALRIRAEWMVLGGTVLACLLLGAGCVMIVREARRQRAATLELSRYTSMERENTLRLVRLAEFGQLLHACQTADEVHGVVAAAAVTLFEAPGTFYRLRSSRNLFERAVAWGLDGPDSFTRDGCWAMRRGRSHTSGEGLNTPRCDHLAGIDVPVRCVPLTNQGGTIGVLVLQSREATDVEGQWRRVTSAAAEQLSSALGSIALRETLRAQAIRDELTGLFNRRFFEEALEREVRRALRVSRPVSLLMCDVDHFKQFNDTWGHEAGDAVLREVGALIRTIFRTEDVGCRYGGEEFVLIISEADLTIARERAEQLRQAALSLHVRHNGQMLDAVTLSIGVACTTDHGTTTSSLLTAADQALYAAKRAGRNRVEVAESGGTPAWKPAA